MMRAASVEPALRDRRSEYQRAATHLLLGAVPVVFTIWAVAYGFHFHSVAYDFHWSYYPAAHRLLHGGSPYSVTHWEIVNGVAFAYPALTAVVFVPFAMVGRALSDHLYMVICFLCVPGTLWALRVRDWRVYGVTMLWLPSVVGWTSGNETLPLTLLIALAWRYRDQPRATGVATAVAVSLKLFVWPLVLWLLATRRWRAAAWGLAWGVLVNLLAWTAVGFGEIRSYLHLSRVVVDTAWRQGYSVLAAAYHVGLGRGVGEVLLVLAAGTLVCAVLRQGLLRHHDEEAMVLAVTLMLVGSPLVWSHYFAVLLVPLALTRPQFIMVWAAPIVMWVCPTRTGVETSELLVAWLVAAVCLIWLPRLRAAPPAISPAPA